MTKKRNSTVHPPRETETEARAFIDEIVRISRKHGMSSDVSSATYEAAVAKATRAFEGLEGAARKPSKSSEAAPVTT